MTDDQYADIGKTFGDVAAGAMLRTDILTPSFMEAVGDVQGKRCLDLACGDGNYTRLLYEAGASEVVGVDISQTMIDLANEKNSEFGYDIQYLNSDVVSLPDMGQFDIVTAVFLLHYAASRSQLHAMTAGIARVLAPNGVFVTMNTNPDHPIRTDPVYSFTRTGPEPLNEGDTLTLSQYQGDEKMYSFDFYHWNKDTYDEALTAAGLTNIQWRVPHVTAEALERLGKSFWQGYADEPNQSIIICSKEKKETTAEGFHAVEYGKAKGAAVTTIDDVNGNVVG